MFKRAIGWKSRSGSGGGQKKETEKTVENNYGKGTRRARRKGAEVVISGSCNSTLKKGHWAMRDLVVRSRAACERFGRGGGGVLVLVRLPSRRLHDEKEGDRGQKKRSSTTGNTRPNGWRGDEVRELFATKARGERTQGLKILIRHFCVFHRVKTGSWKRKESTTGWGADERRQGTGGGQVVKATSTREREIKREKRVRLPTWTRETTGKPKGH